MKVKFLIIASLAIFTVSGCAYYQRSQNTDELEIENRNLQSKIAQQDMEFAELGKAKLELENALRKEITNYKAKLEMTERGLVITFLSEVFFDSGAQEIREDGKESLKSVAKVLNQNVPNSNIAVEGHTDNQPIKVSGWKSNWELSSARALAVVHYLADDCKILPQRLSANAYGEYRPIAANDSEGNMQKNRRVEIVILPSKIKK
jgi:chemotaxis protein MotB